MYSRKSILSSNFGCSSAHTHVLCVCTLKGYLCRASAVQTVLAKVTIYIWMKSALLQIFSKEGRRKPGIRCFFLKGFRAVWQIHLPHSEKPLLQLTVNFFLCSSALSFHTDSDDRTYLSRVNNFCSYIFLFIYIFFSFINISVLICVFFFNPGFWNLCKKQSFKSI